MRNLRILAHVSLDNILDEENSPHGAWTAPYRHPAGAALVAEAQGQNIDLLLGRLTYDLWSAYWPNQTGGHFADTFNAATKHIATHRPETLAWGPAQPLGPDIAESIRALKSQDGRDLVTWGSTTLTPILLSENLADEIVLIVYPVLLGTGKRFFPANADPRKLELVTSKTSPTGAHINTYRPVGPLVQR